jgi:hypothetical protein
VFPPERWAATFWSDAQHILHRLGDYLGYSPPPLLNRLVANAQKIPPRTRNPTGTTCYCHTTDHGGLN